MSGASRSLTRGSILAEALAPPAPTAWLSIWRFPFPADNFVDVTTIPTHFFTEGCRAATFDCTFVEVLRRAPHVELQPSCRIAPCFLPVHRERLFPKNDE